MTKDAIHETLKVAGAFHNPKGGRVIWYTPSHMINVDFSASVGFNFTEQNSDSKSRVAKYYAPSNLSIASSKRGKQ